jgi:hypothetical protein
LWLIFVVVPGTKILLVQDANRQQELNERWLALPQETRNGVKHGAMSTLGSPQPRAGTFAAQVISAIAAIEVPAEQWPDLITQLLAFASDASNVGLRMNALTAIGQICEVVVRDNYSFPNSSRITRIYALHSHHPRSVLVPMKFLLPSCKVLEGKNQALKFKVLPLQPC